MYAKDPNKKPTMTMTNKEQIFALLRATERPGIENLIRYIDSSNYFSRGCYSHHKERGGLAQHSVEVYNHMRAAGALFPADSVAIVALCHDLGKTRRPDGRGHGVRSLDILSECGVELSAAERTAIGKHHGGGATYLVCPLLATLSLADCASTGAWKSAHHKYGHRRAR